MFIFREEIYKPDDLELKGLAEIIIAKQRNGPIGKFNLAFLHNSTRFANKYEGNNEPATGLVFRVRLNAPVPTRRTPPSCGKLCG